MGSILAQAAEGGLGDADITRLVRQRAFAESCLSIPAALRDGSWPLLHADGTTPLRHAPATPLTTLEKRWMKAILADPRIALFQPDPSGLEEVEPLFCPDTFVLYDRYNDGDPYGDPVYQSNFRLALQALREHRALRVLFLGGNGERHSRLFTPYRMEYSQKDDKFRLLGVCGGKHLTVNMARLLRCQAAPDCLEGEVPVPRQRTQDLVLLLTDQRNALQRALLHFSHLEKETLRLDQHQYQLTLRYAPEDETELLIRVLSFGPMVKVISPHRFVRLIRERLDRQSSCEL